MYSVRRKNQATPSKTPVPWIAASIPAVQASGNFQCPAIGVSPISTVSSARL
jgi:hypothetical protein